MKYKKKSLKKAKKQSKTSSKPIGRLKTSLHPIRKSLTTNFQKKQRRRIRQENSLDLLTKEFIKCVTHSKDYTMDINDLVKKLKVKKRRIYDITNVLEGIGYIKKEAKNKIIWLKPELFDNFVKKKEDHEISGKQKKLNYITQEINFVNDLLLKADKQLQSLILEEKQEKVKKYLTFDDICLLNNNTNNISNNLLGIKSDAQIKIELQHIDNPQKLCDEKKQDMENENLQFSEEYLNLCSFSNRLYVMSRDSKKSIDIFLIEPKTQISMNNIGQKNNNLKPVENINDDLHFGNELVNLLRDNTNNINNINEENDIYDKFRNDSYNLDGNSLFDENHII